MLLLLQCGYSQMHEYNSTHKGSGESNLSQKTIHTQKDSTLQKIYQNAFRDFQIGSYYQALDEFAYIAKFPQSRYFLPALTMLAHTYLHIGKRVGNKKYLWDAIHYLNTYIAHGGKRSARYYYLKGLIYEALGFYERGYTNFKLALKKSRDKNLQLDIVMGLLRTAVWLKNISTADRYLMILSVEELNKRQKREFTFLQGMYHFARNNYAKALSYFKQTYRDFESFLIENPHYYLLVAETAYRVGDLAFSETLFRRILNYIKNREVLPRALIRLGDIKFLRKEYQESAQYYIRTIKSFPQTHYAQIAKLKILYIIRHNKKIAYYVKNYIDAPFLHDPMQFIVHTLVKNRRNYLGLFALANFGLEVFSLNSTKLHKRLMWELSLVDPQALKFEHIEYFQRLWDPYIRQKTYASVICKLYSANKQFFHKVFAKDILITVAKYLQGCSNFTQSIALLQFLAQKYHDEEIYYHIAELYMKRNDFARALAAIQKIDSHNCTYLTTKAQICYMGDLQCQDEALQEAIQKCNNEETEIFAAIVALKKGTIPEVLLQKVATKLRQNYTQPLMRRFMRMLLQSLLKKEQYQKIIEIAAPIGANHPDDCFINSVVALSYARLNKVVLARTLLEKISQCKDSWYNLATIVIKDKELEQRLHKGQ